MNESITLRIKKLSLRIDSAILQMIYRKYDASKILKVSHLDQFFVK